MSSGTEIGREKYGSMKNESTESIQRKKDELEKRKQFLYRQRQKCKDMLGWSNEKLQAEGESKWRIEKAIESYNEQIDEICDKQIKLTTRLIGR